MSEGPKGDVKWMSVNSTALIRVRPRRQFAVMPLGDMLSVYTHWIESMKRTQPCLLGGCEGCLSHSARRPLSYLAVAYFKTAGKTPSWDTAILEVPWGTGVTLSGMAGQIVAVRRERPFGPVNVGHFLFQSQPPKVKPFKVTDILLSLWRVPAGRQLCLLSREPMPGGREHLIDT